MLVSLKELGFAMTGEISVRESQLHTVPLTAGRYQRAMPGPFVDYASKGAKASAHNRAACK